MLLLLVVLSLGLDNIGVFDRGGELPTGGHINQSDGTSWIVYIYIYICIYIYIYMYISYYISSQAPARPPAPVWAAVEAFGQTYIYIYIYTYIYIYIERERERDRVVHHNAVGARTRGLALVADKRGQH